MEDAETIEKRNQESLQRIAKLLNHTKELSISNLSELERQGEQLKNINKDITKINHDMTLSERILRGMESFTGKLMNKIQPVPVDINIVDDQITQIERNIPVNNHCNNDNDNDNDNELLTTLSQIKEIASATSKELDRQNVELENMNTNTVNTTNKINYVNKKCKSIL